ncbi:MAG: acyltransferase [Hyphomicrobiaceae bacterium]|nr:acyltransferase [Hyphomicrobiaceae bacterium]
MQLRRISPAARAADPAAPRMGLRSWIKAREHPLANLVYNAGLRVRALRVPQVNLVHRPLYVAHRVMREALGEVLRIVWYTPLFQSRLERYAPGLRVWGGVPLVMGDLELAFGEGCGISGQTTLAGRSVGSPCPRLVVGDNCEIGWRTQISVGRRVELGNNVFMAANCYLAGYPGHPLDPGDRAARKSDTDDQVGDIVLEDDVWLGHGVVVMAGVRIGRGTVVTAGSVVFRDLPPGVIATGNPARPSAIIPAAAPAASPGTA